jgi:hypothetical protein
MNRYTRQLVLVLVTSTTLMATAAAQNQARPLTPLQVQVVLSRYEGDKKVSSHPYFLAVIANHPQGVNLKMGSQVPVPTAPDAIEYKNVGTIIDCAATTTDDGRFQVQVHIEDSSVMERRSSDFPPTLRTFSATNTLILKDGQTAQFTAAADKTTGEVVRVDITMKVEK